MFLPPSRRALSFCFSSSTLVPAFFARAFASASSSFAFFSSAVSCEPAVQWPHTHAIQTRVGELGAATSGGVRRKRPASTVEARASTPERG